MIERALDGVASVGGHERASDKGGRPHLAVDPIGYVRQRRVSVRQDRGRSRSTGIDPAEDVATDQRADPLAVRVVDHRRRPDRNSADEVPVHHPFGGEDLLERQVREPRRGHVLRLQGDPMPLDEVEPEDGVVDVVVARRALDIAPGRVWPVGLEDEARRHRIQGRNIVKEWVGAGQLEVLTEPVGRPIDASTTLDRLADVAAGDAAQPARQDPVWDGCRVNIPDIAIGRQVLEDLPEVGRLVKVP